jgi:hypothetical protein
MGSAQADDHRCVREPLGRRAHDGLPRALPPASRVNSRRRAVMKLRKRPGEIAIRVGQ